MVESVTKTRKWDLSDYMDGVLDYTIGTCESIFSDMFLPHSQLEVPQAHGYVLEAARFG
jgi:hypothetical protein